jgi:hypothetical protein
VGKEEKRETAGLLLAGKEGKKQRVQLRDRAAEYLYR